MLVVMYIFTHDDNTMRFYIFTDDDDFDVQIADQSGRPLQLPLEERRVTLIS